MTLIGITIDSAQAYFMPITVINLFYSILFLNLIFTLENSPLVIIIMTLCRALLLSSSHPRHEEIHSFNTSCNLILHNSMPNLSSLHQPDDKVERCDALIMWKSFLLALSHSCQNATHVSLLFINIASTSDWLRRFPADRQRLSEIDECSCQLSTKNTRGFGDKLTLQ